MKYTFMTAEGREKTVTIKDEVLAQGKREGLTMRETIDRFLSDEGYIVDPVVSELTTKAKAAGINNPGSVGKAKRKPPARKPDHIKRALISLLESALVEDPGQCLNIENVEVTNIERIIAFSIGDDKYEITLSKKRKPKD